MKESCLKGLTVPLVHFDLRGIYMEIRIVLQAFHASKQDEICGDFSFLRRAIAHRYASLIIIKHDLKGNPVLFWGVDGYLRFPFLLFDCIYRESWKRFNNGHILLEN